MEHFLTDGEEQHESLKLIEKVWVSTYLDLKIVL